MAFSDSFGALLEHVYNHPEGRKRGLDEALAAICDSIDATTSQQERRKAIMFLGGARMHTILPADIHEQPYGLVAECRNCHMMIKVPAVRKEGESGVVGRGVEFRCPAAPPPPKEAP